MLGIVAYVISVYLLGVHLGGFTEGQWFYIIFVSIAGIILEIAESEKS